MPQSIARYLIAILGLAVLMIVHETGHFLAARRFGMRVTRFSIGFGPTLFKHKPKDSPTTYQVAIIPFLAYVQIAGMNPYEDNDPNDKESYANASLWGRIVTIAAGPLANYIFASVFFFLGFLIGGNEMFDELRVNPSPDGPAAKAGILDRDNILSINGEKVTDWEQMRKVVSSHPNQELDVEVRRDQVPEPLHIKVTPQTDSKGSVLIQIRPRMKRVNVGAKEAALLALKAPPLIVYEQMRGLARVITRAERPEFTGPLGMTKGVAAEMEKGPGDGLKALGLISALLGAFNLLPIPALDGGRLIFLLFEALSRRRADTKVEATVHAIGLLMFLSLLAFVTYSEIRR